MSEGRSEEIFEAAACGFAKRLNFKHVSENAEACEQSTDQCRAYVSRIVKILAQRIDEILGNELSKDGSGGWAGEGTDHNVQGANLSSMRTTVAQEYLLREVSGLIPLPFRE